MGSTQCNKTVSHLAVSIQELITEANEGLEEVGLDPSGRFNGHLRTVLEHGDRKLGAGHACQPQAKVSVYLCVYMDICACVYVQICVWVDAIHQNLPTSDSAHHLEFLHNSSFHSTVMFECHAVLQTCMLVD